MHCVGKGSHEPAPELPGCRRCLSHVLQVSQAAAGKSGVSSNRSVAPTSPACSYTHLQQSFRCSDWRWSMRAPRLCALAALLAALLMGLRARAAATGAPLSPQDAYTVTTASGDFVLVPSVGWNASLLRLLQTDGVADCADACRADASCMLFNQCDVKVRPRTAAPPCCHPPCRALPAPLPRHPPAAGSAHRQAARGSGAAPNKRSMRCAHLSASARLDQCPQPAPRACRRAATAPPRCCSIRTASCWLRIARRCR